MEHGLRQDSIDFHKGSFLSLLAKLLVQLLSEVRFPFFKKLYMCQSFFSQAMPLIRSRPRLPERDSEWYSLASIGIGLWLCSSQSGNGRLPIRLNSRHQAFSFRADDFFDRTASIYLLWAVLEICAIPSLTLIGETQQIISRFEGLNSNFLAGKLLAHRLSIQGIRDDQAFEAHLSHFN